MSQQTEPTADLCIVCTKPVAESTTEETECWGCGQPMHPECRYDKSLSLRYTLPRCENCEISAAEKAFERSLSGDTGGGFGEPHVKGYLPHG